MEKKKERKEFLEHSVALQMALPALTKWMVDMGKLMIDVNKRMSKTAVEMGRATEKGNASAALSAVQKGADRISDGSQRLRKANERFGDHPYEMNAALKWFATLPVEQRPLDHAQAEEGVTTIQRMAGEVGGLYNAVSGLGAKQISGAFSEACEAYCLELETIVKILKAVERGYSYCAEAADTPRA
jgi:hypothetical protein